ncbi:MAG: hypothetical protein JW755_05590 [Candidatus Aminicenantes bacterium]|nr:hypothetical protein [Candidatus Aminicenantes bacterium]
MRQKDLAGKICKKESYVSEILRPLKRLSDKELEKAKESGLSRSQLLEISKINEKELRLKLIEEKTPVKQIRKLRNKKSEGNKLVISQSKVFEFSKDRITTSLGDARASLKIEFPSGDWKKGNVKEVLFKMMNFLGEFSSNDDERSELLSFDKFKEG